MKARHLVGPGVWCQAAGYCQPARTLRGALVAHSELWVPFLGPVDNEARNIRLDPYSRFIDKEARVLPLRGP
jgi:hypothetical protein